jgi:malate dehydrogenase (quinone)
MAALRRFVPTAREEDWRLVSAGQRVQVLKETDGRGTLVGFGTEVVTSAGGSLAALLGASPGASTAVATALDVLAACFPAEVQQLEALASRPTADELARARRVLGLPPVRAVRPEVAP